MSGEFAPDLLISGLRRREIDIAFTPDVPPPRTLAHDILCVMPLWTETMMAALSEHDPVAMQDTVTWNDLADHTFLVRREGMGSWLMAQALPYLEQHGAPTLGSSVSACPDRPPRPEPPDAGYDAPQPR